MRIRLAAAAAGLVLGLLAVAPAALAGTPTSPAVTITPNPSAPGTATTFDAFCGINATSAILVATSLGLAEHIPMQSTGTNSGEFVITVTLPSSIVPGTYNPDVDCSNGASGPATFRVNAVPAAAPETGDGATSTTTNGTMTAVGFGLAAVGAVAGGLVLARHRRAGS
jgi:hypothetical protein